MSTDNAPSSRAVSDPARGASDASGGAEPLSPTLESTLAILRHALQGSKLPVFFASAIKRACDDAAELGPDDCAVLVSKLVSIVRTMR